MNKQEIDRLIPIAYEALKEVGIAEEKNDHFEIVSTFRGYISSFGAAITMGSFKAAIAFFSKEGKTKEKRFLLVDAIYYVLKKEKPCTEKGKETNLMKEVLNCKDETKLKEEVLNASIALKLAMNMYTIV